MHTVTVMARPQRAAKTRARFAADVVCAILVALLIFLFHFQYSRSDYLLSDSADYVRASRSPFLETYFNTNSASVVELFKLRNDPAFRVHPWDYLYFHSDNAAIRHFHVPFSFYPMHAIAGAPDSSQRIVSSVVTAATCGAIVIGLAAFGVPLSVAVLTAFLAGIQSRYVEVSVDPSPHGWYMLFAVLFLFTFAAYLNTRRFRTLAISAILLACAFATLEFSLELICSIPLALAIQWMLGREDFEEQKSLFASILKAIPIFLLTTFLLWPGGWIRGGYLESYGVTGSTLVFKNKAAFGLNDTAGSIYWKFYGGHEGLLLLSAFAILAAIVLVIRRRISAVTIVFISYTAIAVALGVADHFRLDTYISEALLFLLITVALLFNDWLAITTRGTRKIFTGAAAAVLVLVSIQEWVQRPSVALYEPWLKPIVAGIGARIPPGSKIVVNENWEAYYRYLPNYDWEPTLSPDKLTPRIPERAIGPRYFLLTNRAPHVSGAVMIEKFPTTIAGRTLTLYSARQ
jgi:hypothetical protein